MGLGFPLVIIKNLLCFIFFRFSNKNLEYGVNLRLADNLLVPFLPLKKLESNKPIFVQNFKLFICWHYYSVVIFWLKYDLYGFNQWIYPNFVLWFGVLDVAETGRVEWRDQEVPSVENTDLGLNVIIMNIVFGFYFWSIIFLLKSLLGLAIIISEDTRNLLSQFILLRFRLLRLS